MTSESKSKLSSSESIVHTYTNTLYSILLSNEYNILGGDPLHVLAKILEGLEPIVNTNKSYEVLKYFVKEVAATSAVIQVETGIPEQTVYKCLKNLLENEFIHKVDKVECRREEKGGPRATIYALPFHDSGDILRAKSKHRHSSAESYGLALRITQSVLDDFFIVNDFIEWKRLVKYIKKHYKFDGYGVVDISHQVAEILTMKGKKIVY